MAYRDDLEAAMARIAALEEELAVAGGKDDQRAQLVERAKELEEALATARFEISQLSEKLYGRPTPDERAGMRPLAVSNRSRPTRIEGEPMGVLCPACIALGERVEMVRPKATGLADLAGVAIAVVCPACATLGLRRV